MPRPKLVLKNLSIRLFPCWHFPLSNTYVQCRQFEETPPSLNERVVLKPPQIYFFLPICCSQIIKCDIGSWRASVTGSGREPGFCVQESGRYLVSAKQKQFGLSRPQTAFGALSQFHRNSHLRIVATSNKLNKPALEKLHAALAGGNIQKPPTK